MFLLKTEVKLQNCCFTTDKMYFCMNQTTDLFFMFF